MKRCTLLSVFAALLLVTFLPAFSAPAPTSRDQAIAQGEVQVTANLVGTLLTGIAGAQATLPDKLAAAKALQGGVLSGPVTGYLVFDLGASDGPVNTAGEWQILAIPLDGTEAVVLASAYVYLGVQNDDFAYACTIPFPGIHWDILGLKITIGKSTVSVEGDVKLDTVSQVAALKGVRYVSHP